MRSVKFIKAVVKNGFRFLLLLIFTKDISLFTIFRKIIATKGVLFFTLIISCERVLMDHSALPSCTVPALHNPMEGGGGAELLLQTATPWSYKGWEMIPLCTLRASTGYFRVSRLGFSQETSCFNVFLLPWHKRVIYLVCLVIFSTVLHAWGNTLAGPFKRDKLLYGSGFIYSVFLQSHVMM